MKSGFRGWIYKGWSGCNVKGTVFRFWREWVKWVSTMQKQGTDIGRFDFVLCLHLCLAWLYLLFDIASSSTENHEGRLCPYFGAIRCSIINFFFFFLFSLYLHTQHCLLDEEEWILSTRNDSYSMIIRLTVLFETSFTEFTLQLSMNLCYLEFLP